jgi:hypothetical protein
MSQDEALTIYQECLDECSQALLDGDESIVDKRFRLPIRRRTLTSSVVLETPEDTKAALRMFSDALRSQGMNQLIRLATKAHYLSPDYIEGWHITHTLRNGSRLLDPYENRFILHRVDGVWRVVEMNLALSVPAHVYGFPRAGEASNVVSFAARQDDARRDTKSPMSIYQAFLDRFCEANMSEDFAAYLNLLKFPVGLHIDRTDAIVATEEEARFHFEQTTRMVKSYKPDRFDRIAEDAEFLSGKRICGYHRANIYRDNELVMGPVRSRIVLERVGVDWYMISATNAVSNASFEYDQPEPSDRLLTLKEISGRTDIRFD